MSGRTTASLVDGRTAPAARRLVRNRLRRIPLREKWRVSRQIPHARRFLAAPSAAWHCDCLRGRWDVARPGSPDWRGGNNAESLADLPTVPLNRRSTPAGVEGRVWTARVLVGPS